MLPPFPPAPAGFGDSATGLGLGDDADLLIAAAAAGGEGGKPAPMLGEMGSHGGSGRQHSLFHSGSFRGTGGSQVGGWEDGVLLLDRHVHVC